MEDLEIIRERRFNDCKAELDAMLEAGRWTAYNAMFEAVQKGEEVVPAVFVYVIKKDELDSVKVSIIASDVSARLKNNSAFKKCDVEPMMYS